MTAHAPTPTTASDCRRAHGPPCYAVSAHTLVVMGREHRRTLNPQEALSAAVRCIELGALDECPAGLFV